MQNVIRKHGRGTRLETIHEDQEFLFGPYPQDSFYTNSVQVVSTWVEQIFPCWFEGHEDVLTGIVLHKSEATEVVRLCPTLWETMALILTIKCLRLTLCAIVLRIMRGESRAAKTNPLDLLLTAGFFVTECVTTSRALNTDACVTAASAPFDGHPLIAYVNGISAVWDGCYVLSYALFVVVKL